jgi:hypothetical protein
MYWWKVSKLADDFIKDRVPERERFKYYIADAIVVSAAAQLMLYVGQPLTIWYALSSIAAIIIPIVGVILCYRVNKDGDDADFIGRIVCLGWPLTIKLGVLFTGLAGIVAFAGVIMAEYYNMSDSGPEALNELISLVYEVVLYLLLYQYMKLVSQAKKSDIQILA